MKILTPARTLFENAWALNVHSVWEEIVQLQQLFATQIDALRTAHSNLHSDLQRVSAELTKATNENRVLKAEVTKLIVEGFVTDLQARLRRCTPIFIHPNFPRLTCVLSVLNDTTRGCAPDLQVPAQAIGGKMKVRRSTWPSLRVLTLRTLSQ